ncbi:hypothetical protein [Neoasaia chiangmaiensis]|uniref:hypothetical protein n=1 Tax=Neoasaia chiangmaiensis TaxID=320497 RepID=UPI001FE61952|nr:hypothetical protein [Neoasaia chiangmaiensis]
MNDNPDAEMRRSTSEVSDQDLSEDALRQALARLGSTRKRATNSPNPRPTLENRRRRFVQDGQVVVEHHASRHTVRGNGPSTEDQEEIERLKNLVKLEQRRCEDGQRQLHDVQVQLRSLETRVAHADLHVKELQDFVRDRDAKIAVLTAQIAARAKPANQDEEPVERRSPGRPRIRPAPVEVAARDDGEPEPVKWWIKA